LNPSVGDLESYKKCIAECRKGMQDIQVTIEDVLPRRIDWPAAGFVPEHTRLTFLASQHLAKKRLGQESISIVSLQVK
jgi:hypothetical protein